MRVTEVGEVTVVTPDGLTQQHAKSLFIVENGTLFVCSGEGDIRVAFAPGAWASADVV